MQLYALVLGSTRFLIGRQYYLFILLLRSFNEALPIIFSKLFLVKF